MKMYLGVVVAAILFASPMLSLADSPNAAPWQQQIVQFESRLFEPVLTAAQIDRLLEELTTPATRPTAAKQLAEQGQGHIDTIIRFARRCPDVETRQVCADLVEVLDSSYRITTLGQQLGALYRQHTEALLPAYWKRFRKDPLDQPAVAMLMYGDPEKVYAALGKDHDRHDRLRYLLLRMRELSPDDFARRHLFEHTCSGARLVTADVFPTAGYHRIVGHVARTSIQFVEKNYPREDLPKIEQCNVCRRIVYLYKYQSSFTRDKVVCATLELDRWEYTADKISARPRVVRLMGGWTEQICVLPELKLDRNRQLDWAANNRPAPWWAKPYVPPVYQNRLFFGPKPEEAIAPEEVSHRPLTGVLAPRADAESVKIDPAAPSVVFLPPRLPVQTAIEDEIAAELACDRLAQELAVAGIARVVDRAQVAQILRERVLDSNSSQSLLSYDAMIRLEIDATRILRAVKVSLVNLSTGNVLGEQTFGWPLKEDDVRPLLSLCQSALKGVNRPTAGKLRVRAIWSDNAIANERVAPLRQRLIEVFDTSLRKSERIVLVHHLEAATAKEESLLLLMGLSRLPGQRQFSPQADATVELCIVEGDGRGKTFPETPVEIGVRICKGAELEGDWTTTAGLVRNFDALIPQAWQKLAQSLSEAQPEAAALLVNEMSLRRKQAEAEMQAVGELEAVVGRLEGGERVKTYRAQLAHAEAAVKLDPTYPDAAAAQVRALSQISYFDWKSPKQMPDAPLRTLREAAYYLERFRSNTELCGNFCSAAIYGLYRSPLNRLYGLVDGAKPLSKVSQDSFTFTPELVQGLDAVKQLVERGVEDDVKCRFSSVERMIAVTYRGMELLDVSPADRQAWLEKIYRRCSEKNERIEKSGRGCAVDWDEYARLSVRIAELFIEDGQTDKGKQIVARALATMPAKYSQSASVTRLARAVAAKLDDAQLVTGVKRQIDRKKKQRVDLVWIKWPTVDVFSEKKNSAPAAGDRKRSQLSVTEIRVRRPTEHRYFPRHQVLAEGDGRLYFLVSHSQNVIAYVPLDEQCRPIGKAIHDRHEGVWWNNIQNIPQPKIEKELTIAAARYFGGKLFLGTQRYGLLVFDPKSETWQSYGPQKGIPSSTVEQFFPLGDQLLYGVSQAGHFTFDVASSAVTLVHRADEQGGRFAYNELQLLWHDGNRVMAASRGGIWADLLAAKPTYTPLSRTTCYGWKMDNPPHLGIVGAAEADGRRFYLCRGGLYEIDAAGKTQNAWWTAFRLEPAGGGLSVNTGLEVGAPADCPIVGLSRLFSCGSRLVFVDSHQLTVFDLKTDTWYGPMDARGEVTLVTASKGLWGKFPPDDGVFYLPLDELLDYAKSIGRVMTTAEYRRRKEQYVDAAKPLDRGKLTLGMRQFDKAKTAFQQVLDTEPNQPEALLLMGLLHDRNGLNQPEEAIKYYRQASNLPDNNNASYSGMYLWVCVLKNNKRWAETVELCDKMLDRFPGLGETPRKRIQWLRNHAREQLNQKEQGGS